MHISNMHPSHSVIGPRQTKNNAADVRQTQAQGYQRGARPSQGGDFNLENCLHLVEQHA